MGTEIERLTIGNCYLKKEQQDQSLCVDYREMFEPD
jgi:carbamoyltransferase